MVNCSQLSQPVYLLPTYHLHMNGVQLGPDKLLDNLLSLLSSAAGLNFPFLETPSKPALCTQSPSSCFSQLINPNQFVTKPFI